jgi:aldehyde dehydrogenase (NAD+)
MKVIDTIYINGEFIKPHGTEVADLINPSTNEVIGKLSLGDEIDTRKAVESATAAFQLTSKYTKKERSEILQALGGAVERRTKALIDAMLLEYGATRQFVTFGMKLSALSFSNYAQVMNDFDFEPTAGKTKVRLEPVGVVGIITPWNSSTGFICNKLATAIAAGCTAVIKPSEMSGIQTQVLIEALHEAGVPKGIFNFVNGRGNVVGTEISRNPGISKISFTGSTVVGKGIIREASETLKRVTLELGGKSPNIILDDADFTQAIPHAVTLAFNNSGQACIVGSRLLVPENRLEETKKIIKQTVEKLRIGDPNKGETDIGPMVSVKQYDRVQSYIKAGIDEGAELLIGGLGHPQGLEKGNFVKPTVFVHANNDMKIAREEIFGPVLSVITYKTEEEAIKIANDTTYGLAAYVSSSNQERAKKVAAQLQAGRVSINKAGHDPLAPFGGFKQSGLGREYGVFGLEEYVESKAILEEHA